MKKVIVVIDMQKDFVTGCLGSKEAQNIVKPMVEYLNTWDGDIVFTRDTHKDNYMETQEGKNLPVPHCIENTDGWNIIEELKPFMNSNVKIFNKPTFGSLELASYLKEKEYEEITFVGVCTGICVISNALLMKANMTETKINVIEKLCACVTPESHKTAINAMRLCQVLIQ